MPFGFDYEWKLLLACGALVVGEALGFAVGALSVMWPWLLMVVALAIVWVLLAGQYRKLWCWGPILLLAGLALAGRVKLSRAVFARSHFDVERPGLSKLQGRVTAVEGRGEKRRLICLAVDAEQVEVWQPVMEGVLPAVGEIWEFCGWLQALPKRKAWRLWLAEESFGQRLKIAATWRTWVRRCRQSLLQRVALGVRDVEIVNISRAILLGEREGLAQNRKRMFVASGTIHFFAISGMHVMSIVALLRILLAFTAIPVRWSALVVVPLLWLYAAVVGMCPSVVRAVIMAGFYLLAPIFWRKSNALVAWSMALLIVFAMAPESCNDIGCVMSFTIMLSLIMVGRMLAGLPQRIGVTLAAWLAGMPLAAHWFGLITPGGIIANLLMTSIVAIGVIVGALGALASYISMTLARYLNNFSALFLRLLIGIADGVSRLPFSSIEVHKWTAIECLATYALIVFGFGLVVVRRRQVL